MKPCNSKVEDNRDSRLVKYCILKTGHAGNHSLIPRETCEYPSPDGTTQCGQPIAHSGLHGNGTKYGGKGWK